MESSSQPAKKRHPIHTFDVDNYLNPYIPRPRFDLLPTPISHWFGYRRARKEDQLFSPPGPSVLLGWLFSFVGAFIGIAIIENVFLNLPRLQGAHVPIVVASFGAAAILEYNALASPLSQPRNLIFGHALSAVIGVGVTKLFMLLPQQRFTDLQWLAGAISVAASSTVMSMTNTVHPPAGATALLAATNPEIMEIGWWLVVLVLLASALMLVSAMLVNNLYKKFPVFWWTPADLTELNNSKIKKVKDVEKGGAESSSSLHSSSDEGANTNTHALPGKRHGSQEVGAEHDENPLGQEEQQQRNIKNNPELRVKIEVDEIVVPDWMQLSVWEAQVLEEFQTKLRDHSRSQ